MIFFGRHPELDSGSKILGFEILNPSLRLSRPSGLANLGGQARYLRLSLTKNQDDNRVQKSNSYILGQWIFICTCIFATIFAADTHIPFDVSMEVDKYHNVIESPETYQKIGVPGIELLDFFKRLYEKNIFLHDRQLYKKPRIPKIIHQIWIGEKVPEKFKPFQETWKNFHPDWDYKLWTQDDIHALNLRNIDLIMQSRNPGEIADMLRIEILHRFGGVYVDMDFECLAPLNELNQLYDFYIGIQPLDSGYVQLGIGLIGSIPEHPILEYAIQTQKTAFDNPANKGNACARTGPIFFTRAFFVAADSPGFVDIAFPAHYFYPLSCEAHNYEYDVWCAQGAFGVHHWAKSWLLPDFRKAEFRDLE